MLGTSTSRYSLLRAVAGEGEGGGGGGSGEGGDDGAGEGEGEGEGEGDDHHGDITELSAKELAELKKRAAETEQIRKRQKDLERNNKKLTTQYKEAQARLEQLNKLGTPEEIQEMIAERDRLDEQRARESGQIDQMIEKVRAKYEDKIQQLTKENTETIEALRKRNEELTLGHRLRDSIIKTGVRDELIEPAFLFHRQRIRKVEDPEEEDGYRWVGQLGDAELSVEDYLKLWAENDPHAPAWLKPNINTGAGAPGGGGGNGRAERKPRSKMTAAEKAKFIEDHGAERYWKLAE